MYGEISKSLQNWFVSQNQQLFDIVPTISFTFVTPLSPKKKKTLADYFLDEKDLRDSGLSNLFEWMHSVGFDRVVKK